MPVAGPAIGAVGKIAGGAMQGKGGKGGGSPDYPAWTENAAAQLQRMAEQYPGLQKRGRQLAKLSMGPYSSLSYQPSEEAMMATYGMVRPAIQSMYQDLVGKKNEYLPQGWAALLEQKDLAPEGVLKDMAETQYGAPGEAFGMGGIGTMRQAAMEDTAKAINERGRNLMAQYAPQYEAAAGQESERKYRNMAAMPGVLQNLITGANNLGRYPYTLPEENYRNQMNWVDWGNNQQRNMYSPLLGGAPYTEPQQPSMWGGIGKGLVATDWTNLLKGGFTTGGGYAPGVSPQGYNPNDPYYSMINASPYNPGNEPWASGY